MRIILVDGQKIGLTDCELNLFGQLWNARGAYSSLEDMMVAMYGLNAGSQESMEARLSSLRAKLKITDFRIHNQKGRGWYFTRLPEVIDCTQPLAQAVAA